MLKLIGFMLTAWGIRLGMRGFVGRGGRFC